MYGINNHYCIFLSWTPSWKWPKKTETCRRITAHVCTLLYLIIALLEYIWWQGDNHRGKFTCNVCEDLYSGY